MTLLAVIYAAKSTEDRHGSIPTQLSDCRAMAVREGWTVVGEFSDEAFSAYSGNRGPGLERAKALAVTTAAREGVAVLVAQDADRFARGAGDAPGAADHLGEVYFSMRRQGVQLWTVRSGHIDLLRAAFEGERSHDESARKAQAVKAGMIRGAQAGRASGGPRPYAYRYSGDKNDPGRLLVVPEEAEIVRRIFREFTAGRSLSAIARGLHNDGVQTMRGRYWRVSTVSGLLTNPYYLGRIPYDGEVYDGHHEPIVDRGTYDQAQAIFASRPSRGRGRPPKGKHLFRGGVLRCGACGEAMVPRTNGGYAMYYCNGRSKLGKEFCLTPHIRRADIDSAVYSYFEKVALDIDATRKELESGRDHRLQEVQSLTAAATRAEREASEALTRVKRDYTRGAITAEDWAELRPELIEEQEGARAELARLREQQAEIEAWTVMKDAEQDTLTKLAEIRHVISGEVEGDTDIDAVRAALNRLFERFVVYVDGTDGRIEAVVRNEAWTSVAVELSSGDLLPIPVLRPIPLRTGRVQAVPHSASAALDSA